jgi:hypothetical protein
MLMIDVVLLSHNPQELAVMLVAIDQVAREYGMTINAAKTEIQVQQPAKGAELSLCLTSSCRVAR